MGPPYLVFMTKTFYGKVQGSWSAEVLEGYYPRVGDVWGSLTKKLNLKFRNALRMHFCGIIVHV